MYNKLQKYKLLCKNLIGGASGGAALINEQKEQKEQDEPDVSGILEQISLSVPTHEPPQAPSDTPGNMITIGYLEQLHPNLRELH